MTCKRTGATHQGVCREHLDSAFPSRLILAGAHAHELYFIDRETRFIKRPHDLFHGWFQNVLEDFSEQHQLKLFVGDIPERLWIVQN